MGTLSLAIVSISFSKQLAMGQKLGLEEARTYSGVSRGLVPGGLRRPGTQSVCVRQDRG